MKRIDGCFDRLQQAGRKALFPYIPVGFPHPNQTLEIMHALVKGGANGIELGVPFSDPMADGPVIQQACDQALSYGVSLRHVLELVQSFRTTDEETPIILMSYLNPIEAMGYEVCAKLSAEAQVDAFLLVDCPLEESAEIKALFSEYGIQCIHFLSPTTRPERLQNVCDQAEGFVYYVALKGVTGAAHLDASDVTMHSLRIKEKLKVPLMIGFGVRDGASARSVSKAADGVIIGTELVKQLGENYRSSEGIEPLESDGFLTKAADAPPSLVAARAEGFMQLIREALDAEDAEF